MLSRRAFFAALIQPPRPELPERRLAKRLRQLTLKIGIGRWLADEAAAIFEQYANEKEKL